MHKSLFLHSVALLFCLTAMLPTRASAGTYVTFNIPVVGAGIPEGINKWGAVTGYYGPVPGSAVGYYGFLYQPSGVVTTFSVKAPTALPTYPMSINDAGWIVGYYEGGSGAGYHGFLRNPKYTTLDAPGAGTASNQGTEALSINDAGEIGGIYWDADSVEHGFVRDASGNYTSFDAPGGSAVLSAVLNQSGEVAGTYNVHVVGANYTYGYVMDTTGNITTFDVPGSAYGATVSGINGSGEVTGSYYPSTISIQQFVRDQFGNITTFDIPGYIWTAGIEDNGNVVGTYEESGSNTRRGWQDTPAGAITYFKDPSAGYQGTVAWCVNGDGKIAGYYYDAQGSPHNFVEHN